jgi:hypothetical protein
MRVRSSQNEPAPIIVSKKTTLTPRLNWYKLTDIEILHLVETCDWSGTDNQDPELATLAWHRGWEEVFRRIPSSTPQQRKYYSPGWLSNEIRSLIKQRNDSALKLIASGRSPVLLEQFKKIRNLVVAKIRSARKLFISQKLTIAYGNPKSTWKILNKELGRNRCSAPTPDIDANNANTHFSTIVEQLHLEEQPSEEATKLLPLPTTPIFHLNEVTRDAVAKILAKLKTDTSTGPDGIPPRALKVCASLLSGHITPIFNTCLRRGIYPQNWKIAHVSPIYKGKGLKTEPISYRPIALLSITSKCLEKCISLQIKEHIYKYDILPKQQHGFRPNHSTATCLLSLQDHVINEMSSGKLVAIVALDMSKAFDTVNHKILLTKLHNLVGIAQNSTAHNLIQSYLLNRLQVIKVGGKTSTEITMKHGVPQGSILGPLLFTLYTADLPSFIKNSECFLFADDTTIVCSAYSIEKLTIATNLALEHFIHYAHENKLSVNASKTQAMLVTTNNRRNKLCDSLNLKIGDNKINLTETINLLGITVSNNFKWEEHSSIVSKKARARICQIRRYSRYLNENLRKSLVQTLVFPVFDYCDQIWADLSQTAQQRLDRGLNYAARTVCQAQALTPSQPLLSRLNWTNLTVRRSQHRQNLAHKIYSNKEPISLASLFRPPRLTGPVTRNSKKGHPSVTKARSKLEESRFGWWAPRLLAT